jgi:putative ABC transport system permease protein
MSTPAWRRYLTFWRPDIERDVTDELRFHLDERTADLVAAGFSRADAQRQARAEFGDVDQVSAGLRDIDKRILDSRVRTEWRTVMKDEIRHALRRLARHPAFTVPAVLTLALGIGATTAIYTVVDAVILRPLPFASADRLVYIDSPMPGMGAETRWWLGRHEMFYFKENARALEDLGLYQRGEVTVLGDGAVGAERVASANVSATLLNVLSFRPYVGRLLTLDDNREQEPRVVLLGYDFWVRRFGGDRAIVGKTIPVEGFPMEVVGVLPPGATLPDARIDVWTPAYVDPAMPARNNHTWSGIGRLRPGYAARDLERELAPLVRRFPEIFPTAYSEKFMKNTGFSAAVTPLRDWVVGDVVTRALWILLASVALVFLVAAANVANLFLVRLDARRREIAMRMALGAARGHLAAHFLAEGIVLSLTAAALGVVLAFAGLSALLAGAPEGIPRLSEVRLGASGVAVAVLLAIVTGAVFALVPIARARVDVQTLREGSRTLTVSRRRQTVRGALVAGQVALALVLLAAAGLMVRSFQNLRGVQPGFDANGVLTMAVSLPAARYQNDQTASALFEQIATRLQGIPDVTSVGFGEQVPPDMTTGCTGVLTEAPTREETKSACVVTIRVGPGYFETLGMRVRGRVPTWSATNAGAGPVVITRALAQRFWPDQDAIGKGIRCCYAGKTWYRIVGVAEDVRGNGFDQPVTEAVYFPMIALADAPLEGKPLYQHVIVRSRSGNLRALAPAVRRAIADTDSQIPIANEQSMEQVVARSMAKRTFTLSLLGIAAAMALLLSAIGLYGVVSYVVGQRRSEIGVRVALGAQRAEVGRMIVMHSVRLAVVGVVVGVGAALATTRLLQSLLFEVQPNDPATLVAVSVSLVLLAALASWVPARRAMRVDPVEALRTD